MEKKQVFLFVEFHVMKIRVFSFSQHEKLLQFA